MMEMEHYDGDECAHYDIELELFVLGFDNPVIASDLEVGDFFRNPYGMFPGRWYKVLAVWDPGSSDRVVHVLTGDPDPGEVRAAYQLGARQ